MVEEVWRPSFIARAAASTIVRPGITPGRHDLLPERPPRPAAALWHRRPRSLPRAPPHAHRPVARHVGPRRRRRTGTRRGEARVLIDVRGTGLSGYEIGRRMRRFSGVPLELCREHRLPVVFDADEEIGDRGERLLFALSHACQRSADAVSLGD